VVTVTLLLLLSTATFAQPLPENFLQSYQSAVEAFGQLVDFTEPITLTPQPSPTSDEENLPASPAKQPDPPYTLEALLVMAERENPDLAAARGAIVAARADLSGAKGQRWPTAKLESSGSFIGNPLGPISITAGEFGAYGDTAIPPRDILIYKGMESTQYKFAVSSFVPLYTWGKISQGIELANRGVHITELQYQKKLHEVRVAVRGNWEALAYIRQALELTRLNQRVAGRLNQIAERSADAGFLTVSEVYSARIKLKEIDIALARLEEQRDKIVSELAMATKLPALTNAQIVTEISPAQTAREPAAESTAMILAGNMDLVTLRALIEVKKGLHELALKVARGLPDIGLQLDLSYSGPRFPFLEVDWFRQDDYQFTVSIGTSGNIFGNRVKSGEAAKALAEYEQTVQQLALAEQGIRGFVRETFLSLELNRIKLEFAELQQEAWLSELKQKDFALSAGAGDESAFLSQIMEALGKLAESYGSLAEYRGLLLALEGAGGR